MDLLVSRRNQNNSSSSQFQQVLAHTVLLQKGCFIQSGMYKCSCPVDLTSVEQVLPLCSIHFQQLKNTKKVIFQNMKIFNQSFDLKIIFNYLL